MLNAFCGPPFELIKTVNVSFLPYKTSLFLALVSTKLVGDLHALSMYRLCLTFLLHGSKVTLCLNAVYHSKVLPLDYGSMTLKLLGFNLSPFDSEE